MPPIDPSPQLLALDQGPRLILYHQTHHDRDGNPVSILPVITNRTGVTHVIVAAIHLNDGPGNITLNDHAPDHPRFRTLWSEVAWLQGSGVKVMAMLGGAAQGSYKNLSGSDEEFEAYYLPLAHLLRRHALQGLDLDVEEPVSLPTISRLLLRLRADFGPSFLLTLAPTATALLPNLPHLSGFSYFALEAALGPLIGWYNAQFYCGWGSAESTAWYDAIVAAGWDPARVVMGCVTNPANGDGHVQVERLAEVCRMLRGRYPRFGGVMGWEFFNAGMEREGKGAWEWAGDLGRVVRSMMPTPPAGSFDGGWMRGAQMPLLPQPAVRWPGEDVEKLVVLGFGKMEAIAALNMTDGNVEVAAGLLFDQ